MGFPPSPLGFQNPLEELLRRLGLPDPQLGGPTGVGTPGIAGPINTGPGGLPGTINPLEAILGPLSQQVGLSGAELPPQPLDIGSLEGTTVSAEDPGAPFDERVREILAANNPRGPLGRGLDSLSGRGGFLGGLGQVLSGLADPTVLGGILAGVNNKLAPGIVRGQRDLQDERRFQQQVALSTADRESLAKSRKADVDVKRFALKAQKLNAAIKTNASPKVIERHLRNMGVLEKGESLTVEQKQAIARFRIDENGNPVIEFAEGASMPINSVEDMDKALKMFPNLRKVQEIEAYRRARGLPPLDEHEAAIIFGVDADVDIRETDDSVLRIEKKIGGEVEKLEGVTPKQSSASKGRQTKDELQIAAAELRIYDQMFDIIALGKSEGQSISREEIAKGLENLPLSNAKEVADRFRRIAPAVMPKESWRQWIARISGFGGLSQPATPPATVTPPSNPNDDDILNRVVPPGG